MNRGLLKSMSVLALLAGPSVAAAGCMCEHYSSQYDGICEATPEQACVRWMYSGWPPQIVGCGKYKYMYVWNTWGSAYFPSTPDKWSGFVFYNTPAAAGGGVGLKVYEWDTTAYNPVVGDYYKLISNASICPGYTGGGN